MILLRKLAGLAAAGGAVLAARRRRQAATGDEGHAELTPEDRASVAASVAAEVERLRALSYPELRVYEGHDLHSDHLTARGTLFLRETSVFWDGSSGGALRVVVDAIRPHSSSPPSVIAHDEFIRAPDGSLVDEQSAGGGPS